MPTAVGLLSHRGTASDARYSLVLAWGMQPIQPWPLRRNCASDGAGNDAALGYCEWSGYTDRSVCAGSRCAICVWLRRRTRTRRSGSRAPMGHRAPAPRARCGCAGIVPSCESVHRNSPTVVGKAIRRLRKQHVSDNSDDRLIRLASAMCVPTIGIRLGNDTKLHAIELAHDGIP
jgi:hypothetical protein